jgi:hypothetical protein
MDGHLAPNRLRYHNTNIAKWMHPAPEIMKNSAFHRGPLLVPATTRPAAAGGADLGAPQRF